MENNANYILLDLMIHSIQILTTISSDRYNTDITNHMLSLAKVPYTYLIPI